MRASGVPVLAHVVFAVLAVVAAAVFLTSVSSRKELTDTEYLNQIKVTVLDSASKMVAKPPVKSVMVDTVYFTDSAKTRAIAKVSVSQDLRATNGWMLGGSISFDLRLAYDHFTITGVHPTKFVY